METPSVIAKRRSADKKRLEKTNQAMGFAIKDGNGKILLEVSIPSTGWVHLSDKSGNLVVCEPEDFEEICRWYVGKEA
jgi:hypothetical protein